MTPLIARVNKPKSSEAYLAKNGFTPFNGFYVTSSNDERQQYFVACLLVPPMKCLGVPHDPMVGFHDCHVGMPLSPMVVPHDCFGGPL